MKTYSIEEIINKFGYNPLPLVVKTKVKDKYRLVKPTDIWDSLFEDGTVRSFAADSKGNIYSPYNTDENLPFKIWVEVS